MSTRFIVSAVVGVVVGYFGGPQAGFQAFSVTYGVTGSLDPNQKVSGPRLNDLKGPTASEGAAIPYIEGVWRTAGNYVWNSDKREVAHDTTQGGKGGPGVDSTTFTYEMDVLVELSINQLSALRRVFSNGALVWSAASDDIDSSEASQTTDSWDEIRFYTGAADQLPDPDYEAAVGVGNAPAYRGRATIFIKSLNLGGSGQLPILTFEVSSDATTTESTTSETLYEASGGISSAPGVVTPYVAHVGHILYIPLFTNAYENRNFEARTWDGSQFKPSAFGTLSDCGEFTTFEAGIADEPYWLARGNGANTFISTDDILQDSKGASVVGLVAAAALGYVRCHGQTLLFLQAVSPNNKGLRIIGGAGIDTVYTPISATLYADEWLVFGSDSVIHRYDAGLGSLGTFTAPPATPSSSVLLTDVITGELICHAADALYRWDGTSAWETLATGLPTALQAPNSPASGETMYDGSFSVLKAAGNPMSTGTWTLTTLLRTVSVALNEVGLDQIVRRLCLGTGQLVDADIDVTGLVADTVRGFAVTSGTTRQAIEVLMAAKTFEAAESDKLKFVKRGGAPVATIPYTDLGASAGDPVEPLPLTRANDIELPARVYVKFSNALNDYQDGSVSGDRLITDSTSTTSVELPIVLTPTEAQRIADVQTMDLQTSLVSAGPIALTRKYAALEPTDVLLVVGKDGSQYRTRAQKVTDDGGLRTLELVLDDASAVQSVASADDTDNSTLLVRAVSATDTLQIDGPIGRDIDSDQGFYLLAKPATASKAWPGGVIYASRDGVSYDRLDSVIERATFGSCLTILGDWTGSRSFDEANTLRVDIGAGNTLASSTRIAMLDDQTVNACAVGSPARGWEYLQFRDATLVSDGVYTLAGLLRGGRGTEALMTGHLIGEAFALLKPSGMRRVLIDTSAIGVERYYKVPTVGKALASAAESAVTDNAVGLKPFSPFDVRAVRDPSTHDITLTWQRRTRLQVRTTGPMGIAIPLGEDVEAYSIDIFASSAYASVKRTLTPTGAPSVAYTAAQQAADFGSVQSTVYVRVYQLSAVVGRGTPVQAAA